MAKLSQFDTRTKSDSGVEFELCLLKDGSGSGAFITVQGLDSKAYRDYLDERAQLQLEAEASGKKQVEMTANERGAELAAMLTVKWRGLENDDGSDKVFSKKEAQSLYIEYPLIKEQVEKKIVNRENFLLA